jgi:hypothetical protein
VFVVVVGIVFWGVFALLPSAAVATAAKAGLFAVCVSTWVWLRDRACSPQTSVLSWLGHAVHSALLAALFYGASEARDILDGPHRPKAATPAWLGGLELWWLLCPGALSVALGGAAVRALAAGTMAAPMPSAPTPPSHQPPP